MFLLDYYISSYIADIEKYGPYFCFSLNRRTQTKPRISIGRFQKKINIFIDVKKTRFPQKHSKKITIKRTKTNNKHSTINYSL